MKRRLSKWLALSAVLAVPLLMAGTAGAAIGPPWCGTPEPDGTAALPDGSLPTHPVGSYPHIPWYAIGCTLEDIQSRQLGNRMSFHVSGQSALGKDMYIVVFNALDNDTR